jgi:hypothetical protein
MPFAFIRFNYFFLGFLSLLHSLNQKEEAHSIPQASFGPVAFFPENIPGIVKLWESPRQSRGVSHSSKNERGHENRAPHESSIPQKPAPENIAHHHHVCVAVSMVTARVARSQLNFSFMKSKSGPDITKLAYPLIKKPAPMPCRPSTLLVPNPR